MAEPGKKYAEGSGALVGGAVGGGLALLMTSLLGPGASSWMMILLGGVGAVAGAFVGDYVIGGGKTLVRPVGEYLGIMKPKMPDGPDPKVIEEDFLAGLYLKHNPDVADALLSGKGAAAGYTSAREHYDKFGKAQGKAWTLEEHKAQGHTVPVKGNGEQPHDITQIIIPSDGRLGTAEVQGLFNGTFAKNRVLYLGETDHESPAALRLLRDNSETMKKNGVKHVFLEIDQKYNAQIAAFRETLKTAKAPEAIQRAAVTHLGDIAARMQNGIDICQVIVECESRGIQVHGMDRRPKDMRVEAASVDRKAFADSHGAAFGADALRAGRQMSDVERHMVTHDWVEFIAKTVAADGGIVVLGGTHHQDNFLGFQDGDELLAEKLKCNVVNLEVKPGHDAHQQSPVLAKPARIPANPNATVYTDTPDLMLTMPASHITLAKKCCEKLGCAQGSPEALKADVDAAALVKQADAVRILMRDHYREWKSKNPTGSYPLSGPYLKNSEAYHLLTDGRADDAAKYYAEMARRLNAVSPAATRSPVEQKLAEELGKLETATKEFNAKARAKLPDLGPDLLAAARDLGGMTMAKVEAPENGFIPMLPLPPANAANGGKSNAPAARE